MLKDDNYYMRLAIKQANKAYAKGEVPVGAIVVLDGVVISKAYNLREATNNPLAHAEVLAIQKAAKRLGTWRLEGAKLYVTLEPCPMCAGAILQARLSHVIFGAGDPKFGAVGSKLNLLYDYKFNHTVNFTSGVLKNECEELLKRFFKELRVKKA